MLPLNLNARSYDSPDGKKEISLTQPSSAELQSFKEKVYVCQGPALPRRLPQQITLPEALILKHLPKGTDPQAASGEQGT